LDTPESFYPKLSRFLDRIEDELGLEVVIAGNPRADRKSGEQRYGPRRIEYHETVRLIAESRLVLAHRSTAIGYAVMFRRPVMLLATHNMYEHWMQRPVMDAFAESLGKEIQFIDEPDSVDLDNALEWNDEYYDRYMEAHVKMKGTPDAPYWETVIAEMERHLVESDCADHR
jgi:hypothetical protein